MNEIWAPVPQFENCYFVSTTGKIYSTYSHKLLRPEIQENYCYVKLRHKGCKPKKLAVHRIVAFAFLDNPLNKEEVNHIDGNKSNNNISNLEWATRKENVNHAISHGLRPAGVVCVRKKGKDNPLSKPVYQCSLQGEILARYNCASEAAEINGYNTSSIRSCCGKVHKTYKHYIWKYA